MMAGFLTSDSRTSAGFVRSHSPVVSAHCESGKCATVFTSGTVARTGRTAARNTGRSASGAAGTVPISRSPTAADGAREMEDEMTRDELIAVIEAEADQLDQWADESRSGGWSTHQVTPMRQRADELRRIATRAKRSASFL